MPRGFNVERWRLWHRSRGESYRWLKGFPVSDPRDVATAERDGRIYVEQTINAAWKALVHTTEMNYIDQDFGLILKGTMAISVMPDETFLGRKDRIILPERKALSRVLIQRGSGATDALVFTPVASIVSVRMGTTVYVAGTNYKQTGNTVEWLSGPPSEGSSYAVEYFYNPTYEFLGSDQMPRPGNAGLMPQRGALLQYQPSE